MRPAAVLAARLLASTAVLVMSSVWISGPAAGAVDRSDVDRYLDSVAAAVDRPGVYVDPSVLEDGTLTKAEVAALSRQSAGAPGPVRLMILPADKLTLDRGGVTEAGLAYRPQRLVKELYERVDRAGTYAVLVAAESRAEGQSFYAFQWARGGRTFDIEDAAASAIACCAPDYVRILRRFLKEADDPLKRQGGNGSGSGGGPIVGLPPEEESAAGTGDGGPGLLVFGVVALAAAGAGGLALLVRRRSPRTPAGLDADTAAALRTAFVEEIDELSQRADSLAPALLADRSGAQARVQALRQLADHARGRLSAMRGAADAHAVAQQLAEARFELAAATALFEQRPAPVRTPPCFVDPRHGLSVATMIHPSSGLTTPVPVCAACRAELEVGQEPRPRMLDYRGAWTSHWLAGEAAWVYLHGYWAGQPFMHEHFAEPPTGWLVAPAGPGRPGPPTSPPPGPAPEAGAGPEGTAAG